jgi:CubicO group peptidase (beta-lactamase class C family)
MSNTVESHQIEGTVAPGFESVKSLFEHNMRTFYEKNTQLCVYHKGQKVVDLWATAQGEENFNADSIVNVFSSGKSLEAIAIASLVDKGLLRYEAKIIEYWPEFAAQQKSSLTIADLMRHEAGLAAFNTSIDPKDLLPENIKKNTIGSIIEGHRQDYPDSGNKREYHAITRGWIVNEVFRRVDPAGRTIGEFLREDISIPLHVDAYIGVKKDDLNRRLAFIPLSFAYQFREGLKPKFLGRKMELNIFQMFAKIVRLLPGLRNGTTGGKPPAFIGMKSINFFNDPDVVIGETPSANANCSARGLAKIAAMMSQGGKWNNTQYLSQSAWEKMHDAPDRKDTGFMFTTFTQGGIAQFEQMHEKPHHFDQAFNMGREGFYGWQGAGGSIFQWHPQHHVGFGYVPTSLNLLDIFNERGKNYQIEVIKCIEALHK